MDLDSFLFADVTSVVGPSDYVARVPRTIRTEDELFRVLQNELKLPDYFGHNWDALDECLRDLSWIESKKVVLAHEALPELRREDFVTYLAVLKNAVADWRSDDAQRLVVVFPKDSKVLLQRIESDSLDARR